MPLTSICLFIALKAFRAFPIWAYHRNYRNIIFFCKFEVSLIMRWTTKYCSCSVFTQNKVCNVNIKKDSIFKGVFYFKACQKTFFFCFIDCLCCRANFLTSFYKVFCIFIIFIKFKGYRVIY